MPRVDPPKEFVIRLESGRFYWEPDPTLVWTKGSQYAGPDRDCLTQKAAKKFRSIREADRFATAAGLDGFEVVPYERAW